MANEALSKLSDEEKAADCIAMINIFLYLLHRNKPRIENKGCAILCGLCFLGLHPGILFY